MLPLPSYVPVTPSIVTSFLIFSGTIFESIDGVLFQKEDHCLVYYPAGRKEKVYTIPDGTEVIGESAFDTANFSSIEFPSSLKSIHRYAFSCVNNLKEISGISLCRPGLPRTYGLLVSIS